MTPDEYLVGLLSRESVATGPDSPALRAQAVIMPFLREWAGVHLAGVHPSGSFAKGTANHNGTDIDLFISLRPSVAETLKEIHQKLTVRLREVGYEPRLQNVSIGITIDDIAVDLVPGRQQPEGGGDHSLYRRKADTWTKTNVLTHISTIREGGRLGETRLLKLWRKTQALEFPSFYLELAVIAALGKASLAPQGVTATWTNNMTVVFRYLRDSIESARFVDPANSANVISDDLTVAEKTAIRQAAQRALDATHWSAVIK